MAAMEGANGLSPTIVVAGLAASGGSSPAAKGRLPEVATGGSALSNATAAGVGRVARPVERLPALRIAGAAVAMAGRGAVALPGSR